MSKATEMLEIDKCIASKLWYTSFRICEEVSDKSLGERNKDEIVNFVQLESAIRNLICCETENKDQWITSMLLEKVFRNATLDVDRIKEKQSYVEMEDALRMCKNLTASTEERLLAAYKSKGEDKSSEMFEEAFKECVGALLAANTCDDLFVVRWILNELSLVCWKAWDNDTVCSVHDFYSWSLKELVESGLSMEKLVNEDALGRIVCMVSGANVGKVDRSELVKRCFPTLLRASDSLDIQLALYVRKDKEWFEEWCNFLNGVDGRFRSGDDVRHALKLVDDLFNKGGAPTCAPNKKKLTKRVTDNRLHWVSDIADICQALIISGKHRDYVSRILSCGLLRAFRPVLLLKVLKDWLEEEICSTGNGGDWNVACDAIESLVSKCDFAASRDSVLCELENMVRKNVKVLRYISSCVAEGTEIKDNDRVEGATTSDAVRSRISIKGIFDLRYSNSLLALKASVDMHEGTCEGIEKLLKDLEEGEEALNELKAYRAILSGLKAISLCKSYETEASVIANHFADMKGYALKLYPLDLRVRVIENLFSLLFLRHEDFDQVRKNEASSSLEQLGHEARQTKQRCTGFVCNEHIVKDVLFHLRELARVTMREKAYAKTRECGGWEETEKRIASVNAAIADATWRLKVYTSSEFVESPGLAAEKESCPLRKSNGRSSLEGKSICDRSKERRSQVFFYQEGQISDETRGKSNKSSSEAEGSHGNGKWRKRSKYVALMGDENATSAHVARKPLLVNCMLAPMESLIVRCLWANDYAKAENIIEASGMRNTRLTGEVQFSKALHRFRSQVCPEGIGPRGKEESPANSSATATLENIRMAVQGGIQSSRQTSQFETFLASQEANLRMLSMEEERNGNEILAICALDLALTTCCQIYPVSQNLCEVALKYLELCKTFESTEHARFFYKFYQLLGENILSSAKIGFSAKEWKEREDFWTGIAIKHREFRESQARRDASDKDKVSKDGNCLPGLKPLRKMVALCCGTKGCIQNVYSHLQLLHTIVPAERATIPITESDLLRIPLHYYFGYQIFQLKIEPRKLETIAHDLQVNLAYSILKNACLFWQKEAREGCRTVSAENECTILNGGSRESARGANRCVAEILAELVNVLLELSSNRSRLSREFCQDICNRAEVQSVLKKTSRLARLDVSELSGGEETLAFLLNTWNLMFLHASLTVWANQPPFTNELQRTVSLMSVGYSIADLGLVTLAALRSKLLKDVPFAPFPLFPLGEEPNEPAWQDFDISPEPRAIFGMANEYPGTPCVRVYDPASLEQDLTVALGEYFDHYSRSSEQAPLAEFRRIAESRRSEDDGDAGRVECTGPSLSYPYSYDIILRYDNCSTAAALATQYRQEARADFPWKIHGIRSSLLQYLEGQCWPVSYLLQRMYNECPTILDNNCDKLKRTACLENLLISPWIRESKILFENNETLAAIFETVPIQALWSHFELMLKDDKWNGCLKLINALPNRLALRNDVQYLKDKVLSRVVSKQDSPVNKLRAEILPCFYQIKDARVSSQTALQNIEKWEIDVCENALLHAADRKLPVHCSLQLKEILHRVLVFREMLPYCATKSNGSWYDVAYCTEKIDPLQIVGSLINAEKFQLCLEWLECQAFSFEMHPSATEEFLIGLLKSEIQNYKQTLKFLQALPLDQSMKLCKTVLKRLETVDSLRFICDYLWRYCKATETTKYRQTLLGIDILSMLDARERPLYIHLIKEPLLMLEQLLMNCKFESIRRVLSKVREKLDGADISRGSFDAVVRFYAKKSLDCRVSLLGDNAEGKSRSVQSPTSETENTEFVMPALVPTKEEWVPNDKARKCSCCKNVIFSMFNRRHHCRRCGRVICATCSQHRIQVSGYPSSVLVRACDDCKRQTVLQMEGTLSTPSSETFDYWRLTRDERHNETIREEFSFEYAPNISLCLAILNLHSEHKSYASFLLDRCDEMKLLLQPVNGGKVNPEVDHSVIINMIRSLLLAAKVKCAKLGLNAGLVHCDRFLSHVDLIASLVRSDCLHLIPSDSLQNHTLRKLRDILIEKEEWTLALDVSTKAGLDTQGVWATWGRACLKMEYFVPARDKFFHCLDKVHYEHFDDWVILPRLGESESSSKKQVQGSTKKVSGDEEIKADDSSSKRGEFSKSRPLKDPPLLTEILQMLDNLRICSSAAGQETFTGFGNLRFPNQKQLDAKRVSALLQNICYNESLDYLLTYGSYNSILEFFLRHDEFDKCLGFTLENHLEPDLFLNAVYLHCLRNGNVEKLHEEMSRRDSSLFIWKKYLLYVCQYLERRQYLNILYQLQLFMKDSVRAAMTCIRFYLNDASSYTDLCGKTNFLLDAQTHLESELEIETLNRRRKRSTSSVHCNQGILTMEMEPSEIDKHVNTISRQMEIAKFLGNCEKEGRSPVQFLDLLPGKDSDGSQTLQVPTLFGNQQQKIDLAVLAILCGCNIEEGFGIAFRIMQDYNLPQQKVYSLAGHILTVKNQVSSIQQLIQCCHTSGIPNSHVISDYVLSHCVKLLITRLRNEPEAVLKTHTSDLVRLITDTELKINAYIECKQLKSAYLLAVKHSRAQDVRRILKESERLGQNAIKAICMKWLQQEPKL